MIQLSHLEDDAVQPDTKGAAYRCGREQARPQRARTHGDRDRDDRKRDE